MIINQLVHENVELQQRESMSPDVRGRVFPMLRRCLVWAAIILTASWIIAGHIFC